MSRAERASREPREPREPRARDPPARRAAARLNDFSDEALLAELGDAGDGDGPASDGDETFESPDVLERRLRRELARMPDSTPCDEEEAIRREIEATDDEPDEATALYLSLMQDERSDRARRRAEREAVADSIARSVAADTAERVASMRAETHAEKMEAVRLNRAGDKEGARAALRRAKAAQARADEAEANETLSAERSERIRDSGSAIQGHEGHESPEKFEQRVKALRVEAVRLNRAGDREGARAALRRAKATQARADEAERTDAAKTSGHSSSERRTTDHDRDDPLGAPGVLKDLDPRASAHLEALMASARSEMTRLARSEDPEPGDESGVGALSSDESGDARLLSDALGADHDDAHFSGAYDGRAADGTTRDVDAGALALERCAELEGEIREIKKRASAASRAGETDAARAFLEAAEAMREELRETRAFAEDEAVA